MRGILLALGLAAVTCLAAAQEPVYQNRVPIAPHAFLEWQLVQVNGDAYSVFMRGFGADPDDDICVRFSAQLDMLGSHRTVKVGDMGENPRAISVALEDLPAYLSFPKVRWMGMKEWRRIHHPPPNASGYVDQCDPVQNPHEAQGPQRILIRMPPSDLACDSVRVNTPFGNVVQTISIHQDVVFVERESSDSLYLARAPRPSSPPKVEAAAEGMSEIVLPAGSYYTVDDRLNKDEGSASVQILCPSEAMGEALARELAR